MRILLLVILVVSLACNSSEKPGIGAKSEAKPNPYSKLLSLYKPVKGDTLMVFSAENLENKAFAFYGRVIDSANAKLFPKDVADAHFADFPSLFACYKIPLDANKVGLITRAPSVYMPSSIKLFIVDTVKYTLEQSLELAEEVGDAGDVLIKKSWVFKTSGKRHSALIWIKELHDHSVDEEIDSIPENWDSYFLVDLSKASVDTTSEDSLSLRRRFEQLLSSRPVSSVNLKK